MSSSSPFSSAQNPFTANAFTTRSPFESNSDDEHVVSATAAEGTYTYAMVQSAPAVIASEVESNADAIEVTVRWGQTVLHVAHLSPVRSFSVGEDAGCDFVMPANKLGVSRLEIVSVDSTGRATALVAPSAIGKVTKKGSPEVSLEGGASALLEKDGRVSIELGAFTFEVASVNAGLKVKGGLAPNKRSLGTALLAGAVHAGLFAAMFAFTPALNNTEDGDMTADQRTVVSQTLAAMAEKDLKEVETQQPESNKGEKGGDNGGKAVGTEGSAGLNTAHQTNKAWANKGSAERPALTHAEAVAEAQSFGMIGLLNGGDGRPSQTSAAWATADESNSAVNAKGALWGDGVGDNFGEGGLGLSGDGLNGGGLAHGIGMGSIDTAGHGNGTCTTGDCSGWGTSGGFLPTGHHAKAPGPLHEGVTKVSGRLPPEVIQRVLRQNYGRFRMCYQNGLQSNPSLAGRVSVSFVIGVDGSVGSAANGGSDLPDPQVVSCVVRAFGGISFPAPSDGVVKVTYPIAFTPAS